MLSPLRTPNRCFGALTDVRQLLQPKCLLFSNSLRYESFTNTMINIFLEALFCMRILFQAPFGVPRATVLQPPTVLEPLLTDPSNRDPLKNGTIVGGQKIDDPEIAPNGAERGDWSGSRARLRYVEIPGCPAANQFRAPDLPRRIDQCLPLERTHYEYAAHAPVERIQTHLLRTTEAIAPSIVANTAGGAKGGTAGILAVLMGGLDRFDGFIAGTTGQLGTESKLGADGVVDMIVEGVFIGDTVRPRHHCTPRGRSIKGDLCRP